MSKKHANIWRNMRGQNTPPSTHKLNNSFTSITIDYTVQKQRYTRIIQSVLSHHLINPDYRMPIQNKQWVSSYRARVGLAGGERVRAGVSQYSRVIGEAGNYKT